MHSVYKKAGYGEGKICIFAAFKKGTGERPRTSLMAIPTTLEVTERLQTGPAPLSQQLPSSINSGMHVQDRASYGYRTPRYLKTKEGSLRKLEMVPWDIVDVWARAVDLNQLKTASTPWDGIDMAVGEVNDDAITLTWLS